MKTRPRPIHILLFIVTILAFSVGSAGVGYLADIGHGRIPAADIQRIIDDNAETGDTTVIVQVATGLGIRQNATASPASPPQTNNGILALATILCCLLVLGAGAIAIRLPQD